MKRVAVVFFGQPRFIEKTYKSILQEFSFPGYETDCFFHFWNKRGFNSRDDETDINEQQILDFIQPKDYLFTDYTDLNIACEDILGWVGAERENLNDKTKIRDKNIFSISKIRHLKYFLGQFVSMNKGFTLFDKYRTKNNIEYDMVFRVRTDLFFIPPFFDDVAMRRQKYERSTHEKELFYFACKSMYGEGVYCTPGSLRAWINHNPIWEGQDPAGNPILTHCGPAEDLVLSSFYSYNNYCFYTLRDDSRNFYTHKTSRISKNTYFKDRKKINKLTLHIKDWLLWGTPDSMVSLCTNLLNGLKKDITNCREDLNTTSLNYNWGAGELINGETVRECGLNCYEVPIGVWRELTHKERVAKIINKQAKENLFSIHNVVRDDVGASLEDQFNIVLSHV